MSDDPLSLEARQLGEETIIFGKNMQVSAGDQADFGRAATSNEVIEGIDLQTWLFVYTERDSKQANGFVDLMLKISRPLGVSVAPPTMQVLKDDRTDTYVQALRKQLEGNPKIQMVVILFPTARDDRYAAVKKICCSELPVPSQVGSFRIKYEIII